MRRLLPEMADMGTSQRLWNMRKQDSKVYLSRMVCPGVIQSVGWIVYLFVFVIFVMSSVYASDESELLQVRTTNLILFHSSPSTC